MKTRSIWKQLALASALASVAWCQAPNPPAGQQKSPPKQQPRYRSIITVYELAKHSATTLYQEDQIIEAPNWSRDGKFLMVNRGRNLYKLPVAGEAKLEQIVLAPGTYRCN